MSKFTKSFLLAAVLLIVGCGEKRTLMQRLADDHKACLEMGGTPSIMKGWYTLVRCDYEEKK